MSWFGKSGNYSQRQREERLEGGQGNELRSRSVDRKIPWEAPNVEVLGTL